MNHKQYRSADANTGANASINHSAASTSEIDSGTPQEDKEVVKTQTQEENVLATVIDEFMNAKGQPAMSGNESAKPPISNPDSTDGNALTQTPPLPPQDASPSVAPLESQSPQPDEPLFVAPSLLENLQVSAAPTLFIAQTGLRTNLPDARTNDRKEETVVVTSDRAAEPEQSVLFENLPTDKNKTRITIGAILPVIISSEISTATAKKGDLIEAKLKYDLKIGDRLVARKGATVIGYVSYCLKAPGSIRYPVSRGRQHQNTGCLGIVFDEIITEKGEHLPLSAAPASTAPIIPDRGEDRALGVNDLGQVIGLRFQPPQHKPAANGHKPALQAASALALGSLPVVPEVTGTVSPSLVFMTPVETDVSHHGVKDFVRNAWRRAPGWGNTEIEGQEAVIRPGDEFLVEFKKEFTGEPQTKGPNSGWSFHCNPRTFRLR